MLCPLALAALPAGLATTLVAALPAPAAAARPEVGPLPWRVAGVTGFTVDAASFPDSSGDAVEVYVRIPPSTIADLARDSSGAGSLRIEARLRPGAGQNAVTQDLRVGPIDSTSFGKVLVLRLPAKPGAHRLFVRLEDTRSRKRGIAYMGRQVTESSEVEGPLVVPKPVDGRRLSSIEFVWEDSTTGGVGPFHRAGHALIPNPERLYGRYAPRLKAFFIARAANGEARPWQWLGRVSRPGGEAVWEQQGVGPARESLDASCQIDLDWPAGGYDLTVEAWQEGDAAHLTRTARFSVAWAAATWFRNPSEVEDNVHFLLTPDGVERFALLHPGEQERFMEDFWKRRDPTPATEVNEARETFEARVAIANRRYSRAGIGLGMFSDMGRTFIRYGEPNELLDQVIPTGDDTISELLEEFTYSEDRPIGDVHHKGLGGDQRPFQVWIYEGEIPLPPDVEPGENRSVRHRRLRFLFVDERGTGDYRMRYASE